MIPIERDLNVIHSGEPLKRRKIKLSEKNIERVIPMLRDEFYSNKELAPIREYSTNAGDAHIRKGISTTPIHVTLPSRMEPTFKVRDFGFGLTELELDTVYFDYCESTKRNTNDENGVWGIGSKSAFAYTESFVVTTWCEGHKTIMNCTIDGNVDTIYKQPSSEPEGVEISIPVQEGDVDTFIELALNLFKYWEVRPVFHNVEEDTLKTAFATMDTEPFLKGDGWEIRPAGYGDGEAVALMGFVPYPVDWNQISNKMNNALRARIGGIFSFLQDNVTTLRFPNGALQFTPNREALQYKDETLAAVTVKLTEMHDVLLNLITNKIAEANTLWDAKIAYNRIFRREMDGFDKTQLFAGDLQSLENLLCKKIQWRGIVLENGLFTMLDYWDKHEGKLGSNYSSGGDKIDFLLQTFIKNDKKANDAKLCRCQRKANNKIICSPRSRVIIQDVPDKTKYGKVAARWMLHTMADVGQVYVLDLSNTKVKDEFFKHYNFDSVPVIYTSDVQDKVKAWAKSVRVPGGGGGGNSGPRPIQCNYVEIENRKGERAHWKEETVNARGMKGGVFVNYVKGEFILDGHNMGDLDNSEPSAFIQGVYQLLKLAGVKLAKVHGLHRRTTDSVWFQKAVADGYWTPLSTILKDAVKSSVNVDLMKQFMCYDGSVKKWGTVMCGKLKPLLTNKTGQAYQYCELMETVVAYRGLETLIERLDLKDWSPTNAEQKDFNKVGLALKERYPMVFRHGNDSGVTECDENERYYTLKKDEIQEIADYINLVDK